MDELEFRRRAYADPDCQEAEFLAFKNKNSENEHFVVELQALNDKLEQALNIHPPADLAERIKLKQNLDHHQTIRHRWHASSMVASVVLLISLVFIYLPDSANREEKALANNVMEHIYHELNHLYEKQNRSLQQVNTLLSGFGGSIKQNIGQINYLGSCDIADKKAVHIVLQGSVGPVTVVMLPDVPVNKQQIISDKRFSGLIKPAGKGSMAVVGEKGELLEELSLMLDAQLRWI